MTTTNTKGVPRSRLNITYRTHVEGREVKKELPLRLLVAGDFSGRRTDKTPELPLLDRRLMYAIGKSGSLESMLKVMRVGLPVPADLTHECEFEVTGSANVRITRGGDGVLLVTQLEDGRVTGQVSEHRAGDEKTAASSSGASAKKDDAAAEEDEAAEPASADATPSPEGAGAARVAPGARYEGRIKLSAVEVNEDLEGGAFEVPTRGVAASGWLVPTKQPPREAPIMYQTSKLSKLRLTFEEPLFAADVPREGIDRRVGIFAEIAALQVVPLLDMKSFEPGRIAESVPEIRRLLVLRWLVSQGRSMIAANPVLRSECKKLLPLQSSADGEGAAQSPLGELKTRLEQLNADGVFDLERQW